MKKKFIYVIILFTSFIFAGCSQEEPEERQPKAVFTYVQNGTTVQFINKSIFAKNYYWTFGDGGATGEMSPLKDYASSGAGTYIATLTVQNITKTDMCSDTIVIP